MKSQFDYTERPFLIIWEATRACGLACVHCRAEAQPEPDPDELTTHEAMGLIDAAAGMGTPVFIFSGGDPMRRADIHELVRYAKSKHLRVGIIPAASEALGPEMLRSLKEDGVDQVAFSLDAADADAHDHFRQVPGVFRRTLDAVAAAHALGLRVQINTLINWHNLDTLDRLIALVESLPIVFWEVFFLVPTGRGQEMSVLSAEKFEQVFAKLYDLNRRAHFVLKVTEAPHYRRYFSQRENAELVTRSGEAVPRRGAPNMPEMLRRSEGPGGSMGLAPRGVNAGKGFVFISRTGQIMPSGFLPIEAGNVRQDDLAEIYRNSAFFRELREASFLKGRCGLCEYAEICGGSRARALAMKGDYLEEDPCCAYLPEGCVQGRPGGV